MSALPYVCLRFRVVKVETFMDSHPSTWIHERSLFLSVAIRFVSVCHLGNARQVSRPGKERRENVSDEE